MPLKNRGNRAKASRTKTYERTLPPSHRLSKKAAKAGGGPVTEKVVIENRTTPPIGDRLSSAATAPLPGQENLPHSHSGVLFWGLLLVIASTWDGFWSSLFKTMWGVKDTSGNYVWAPVTIEGQYVLGAIIFVVVLSMIANSSDAAGTLIAWMLAIMWIIFVTQNGIAIKQGQKVPSGIIVDFFHYFTKPTSTTKQSGGKP